MNKILLSTIIGLTLLIFGMNLVSASHYYSGDYYGINDRYTGSFRPSYYSTYGNSFQPYQPSNSYYYPSRYSYNPTDNFRNYPYYNTRNYNRPYTTTYTTPIYLNSQPSPSYSFIGNNNKYYPTTFSSSSNAFDNNKFANFNQNQNTNSFDSFSYTKTPCQSHKRILDFDGKRNDIFDFYEVCDGTSVRQNNQNSFGNSINNQYGFNNRNFGNSQKFNY